MLSAVPTATGDSWIQRAESDSSPSSGIGMRAGPYGAAGTPAVSIVLATLNEGANLPTLFRRISQQSLPRYELIVVDDGSTDGTREFLSGVAKDNPLIIPIFHDGPQTLSPALRQGIQNCRGEFVIVMDSDLQHPPEKLAEIFEKLESGASLVVGSRYGVGGDSGGRSVYRAVISRGAELIARTVLKSARRVSDPMSGFFGFRADLYQSHYPGRRGYKLLLTMLPRCDNERVAEVAYSFGERSSGVSKITHGFQFVWFFLGEVIAAKKLEIYLTREGNARSSINAGHDTGVADPVPRGRTASGTGSRSSKPNRQNTPDSRSHL